MQLRTGPTPCVPLTWEITRQAKYRHACKMPARYLQDTSLSLDQSRTIDPNLLLTHLHSPRKPILGITLASHLGIREYLSFPIGILAGEYPYRLLAHGRPPKPDLAANTKRLKGFDLSRRSIGTADEELHQYPGKLFAPFAPFYGQFCPVLIKKCNKHTCTPGSTQAPFHDVKISMSFSFVIV